MEPLPTALSCPSGSRGWTSGQWGLREKVMRKREKGVVRRIGAGRAGVPWVWDPKSSHRPKAADKWGWEGGGERWAWQGSVVKVTDVLS